MREYPMSWFAYTLRNEQIKVISTSAAFNASHFFMVTKQSRSSELSAELFGTAVQHLHPTGPWNPETTLLL